MKGERQLGREDEGTRAPANRGPRSITIVLRWVAAGVGILCASSCVSTGAKESALWVKTEAIPETEFPRIRAGALLCLANQTSTVRAGAATGILLRALHDSLSYSFTSPEVFEWDVKRLGRTAEHSNLVDQWRKHRSLSPRIVRRMLAGTVYDALLVGEVSEYELGVGMRLDLYSAEGTRLWSASGAQDWDRPLVVDSRHYSSQRDSQGQFIGYGGVTTTVASPSTRLEVLADRLARALVSSLSDLSP